MAFRAMKALRQTRRILHTATLPMKKWGGEVSGFTTQELDGMRRITKQVYGHSHMSPDVFGAMFPEIGPLGKTAFMPLGRCLEEWWGATDERHRHG
eukprot:5518317-Pyramimonas_sp.AAC.1